jgi:hypothetical protein
VNIIRRNNITVREVTICEKFREDRSLNYGIIGEANNVEKNI